MVNGLLKLALLRRFPRLALLGLGAAMVYRMIKGRRAH